MLPTATHNPNPNPRHKNLVKDLDDNDDINDDII